MSPPSLNIAHIASHTEAEGPGFRYAIWGQGCPLRCPGCCNPEMLPFIEKERYLGTQLVQEATESGSEGISLLGGEPFAQADGFAYVAEQVQMRGLSVMVFSGFSYDELKTRRDPGSQRLLAATDLLVDGPYDIKRHTTQRRWIGSENQGLRFLSNRYHPDDSCFHEANHIEIRLSNGEIQLNGWPILGAKTKLASHSKDHLG